MQNTGQGPAPALSMPIQLISREGGFEALGMDGERSLWTTEAKQSQILNRFDSPLLLRLERRRGKRRLQLYPVIFAAVAAVAAIYLLLRCARHLEAINTPKGALRSLAAAEEDEEDASASCGLGGQEGPTLPALEGEFLDEKHEHERAAEYTKKLAHMFRSHRRVFQSMPMSTSIRGFTNVLRFCVVELASLCSLLSPENRGPLNDAVEILIADINTLRRTFTRKATTRSNVRHINCMRAFLEDMHSMKFEGASMTRGKRLTKLAQLLTVQELALSQVEEGLRLLILLWRHEGKSLTEYTAEVYLNALYKSVDVRRNDALRDAVFRKWLLEKQYAVSHFGLAAPQIIKAIARRSPMLHEDVIKELLDSPLGIWQQQKNQQASGQTELQASMRVLGVLCQTKLPMEPAEAPLSPPGGLRPSDASVTSEPSGVGMSAAQPERSGTPGSPTPPEQLGSADNVGTPAAVGADGESSNPPPVPLSNPRVSPQVSAIPASPWTTRSRREAETSSSAEGSAFLGVPRPQPSSSSGAFPPLASSGHSVTWSSVPDILGISDIWEPKKPSWPFHSLPPQVSTQLEISRTVFTPALARTLGLTTPTWAFDASGISSTWQRPQVPSPKGFPIWSKVAAEAQAGADSDNAAAWPAYPAIKSLWDAPATPSPSQLPFPIETRGRLDEVQYSAQPYNFGETSTSVAAAPSLPIYPPASSIWHYDKPPSQPAAVQPSPWRPGMLAPPPGIPVPWTTPKALFGVSPQASAAPQLPGLPFKGVALGEPEGGIDERSPIGAAHVAATLFPPAPDP